MGGRSVGAAGKRSSSRERGRTRARGREKRRAGGARMGRAPAFGPCSRAGHQVDRRRRVDRPRAGERGLLDGVLCRAGERVWVVTSRAGGGEWAGRDGRWPASPKPDAAGPCSAPADGLALDRAGQVVALRLLARAHPSICRPLSLQLPRGKPWLNMLINERRP
jgi:hypothetical protein